MITLMLTCLLYASSGQVKIETRAITNADTCLAVYVERFHGPFLVVVVWSDGKVVWSKDDVRGGSPFFTGNIKPQKVMALIAALNKETVLTDKSLELVNYGPDAAFTSILIKAGKHILRMESWHELEEVGGGVVSTQHGAEPLAGRKIEDVLKEEPLEYQKYRRVWKSIRQRLGALIPSKGKEDKGEVKMLHGVITWVEP
jgi:hypothetical protein